MRTRIYAPLMLVCLLALPVLAGEVNTPGVVNPPLPPTCATATCASSTTTLTDSMRQIALELVLSLIKQ